jgi:mannose-1-phosphate guanylyltransferase
MKAIILAAGKGTRLRPLTYGIPKPLLPIKGKPMVEWVINSIINKEVDEIIVAVSGTSGIGVEERILSHIHGICIDSYLRNLNLGVNIKTIPTPMRETAGDLRFILEEENIRKGKIIVIYGDNLTSFDLDKMIKYHDECKERLGTCATVLLFEAPEQDVNRFGIAKIRKVEGFDLIDFFIEKPELHQAPSRFANSGYYILEVEEIFDKLSRTKTKVEHSLFPQLAAEGKLAGFISKLPYWIDISTLSAYESANKLAHDGLILAPSLSDDINTKQLKNNS